MKEYAIDQSRIFDGHSHEIFGHFVRDWSLRGVFFHMNMYLSKMLFYLVLAACCLFDGGVVDACSSRSSYASIVEAAK